MRRRDIARKFSPACWACAERWAIRRGEFEEGAEPGVFFFEEDDAGFEGFEVGGAPGAEGALDVAGTVWGEVVVSLAAALGRYGGGELVGCGYGVAAHGCCSCGRSRWRR